MAHHRLIIIGSGPAGYTAAIYAARAQLAPLVLAGYKSGGQLMWTTDIENYPGFVHGKPGPELMSEMRQQSERFGAQVLDEFAGAVDFSSRPFKVWRQKDATIPADELRYSDESEFAKARNAIRSAEPDFTADAVIIATGATSIMLGVEGETTFLGKGVSTCAVCDAAFYRDKDTIVVGGGDSAMEDSLALTKFAKSVTIVHRRSAFRASKIMQERVLQHKKVKVFWNSTVKRILGAEKVAGVVLETQAEAGKTKETNLAVDGVFVAIGHRPVSQLFQTEIELDSHGYIVTRQSLSAQGMALAQQHLSELKLIEHPSMTSVEGVFAAGDVVDVRYKQAITAAGQGAQAAIDAERWLESLESV